MTIAPTSPTDHAYRPGVGKHLMGATGGWGCERERYFGETVRDERGWRLGTASNPNMTVGTAVDAMMMRLLQQRIDGASLNGLDLPSAVEAGFSAARGKPQDHEWTDEEWDTLRMQLVQAGEKALGIRPNHPDKKDSHPGPPILWLDPKGLTLQGRSGESLRVSDPLLGDRPLTGTPDCLYVEEATITAWVDIKANPRAYSFPKKWVEPEAVLYDYMATALNGGLPPERHAYFEYRRNAKPYWHLTWAPVVGTASLTIARNLMSRWHKALVEREVDGLAWDASKCGECPYREAIPEYDHPGCAVGQAVVEVAPPTEENA